MSITETYYIDHKVYNHNGEEIPGKVEFLPDKLVGVIKQERYSPMFGLGYQMIANKFTDMKKDEIMFRAKIWVQAYLIHSHNYSAKLNRWVSRECQK